MYEFAIAWEWVSLAVRWVHVITGIAWIGSSFYFVALDLGLRQRPGLPAGAHGEEWQVHGGGFYHIQKYLIAPADMPEHLTWFKWESYATWLSGFAMLCIVYYLGADLYLVDKSVLDISPLTGIAISLASIGLGWLAYDIICKSPAGANNTGLMLLLFGVLIFAAWGYVQLFTGRAALLHLGVFTATIMSANVFFIIIPNQKKVVTTLLKGETPDPALGKQAKQRSLHNNYLTLPVLFLMLSSHYPLVFGTRYNWIIASMVFLMGVTIRHYFNSVHARKGNPTWTWLATALIFIVIMWLSTSPKLGSDSVKAASPLQQRFIADAHFPKVRDTVLGRCAMCHAKVTSYEGVARAPKGVMLETDAEIAAHARELYLQAGRSNAMPPANVTGIRSDERAVIVAWFESVTTGQK
jgi:uncharacterized membrane protein